MAPATYQNQKENFWVLQQQQQQDTRPAAVTIKREQRDETEKYKKKKTRKIKNVDNMKKNLLKLQKREKKKARLLSDLQQSDLQMKLINSSENKVNKQHFSFAIF